MRGQVGLATALFAVGVLVLLLAASTAVIAGESGGGVVGVGGVVNGTVVWANATYRVVGMVVVEGRLVVEPGTVVEFSPGSQLVLRNSTLVVMGAPGAPVVFSPLPGGSGGASITLYNSSLEAVHVVFRGTTRLGLVGSGAKLSGARLGQLLLAAKDSQVRLENATLESLVVMPLYPVYTRSPVGGAGLLNTTLVLSSSLVEYYLTATWGDKPYYYTGGTGYAYPIVPNSLTLVRGSEIVLENSGVLLGVTARLYNSSLVVRNSTTREILVGDLEDSNLVIEDSLLAWGRGVYVNRALDSNITVRNTSIHDTFIVHEPGGMEKAGVIVELANSNTVIDLRENWWGSPSGPSGPLNPEGEGARILTPPEQARIYPWLGKPPRPETLEPPSLEVIPPYPVNGEPAIIAARGPGNALYLFIVEKPNGLQPRKAGIEVNELGRLSIVFYMPGAGYTYTRRAYCIAYHGGLLAGTVANITVVPKPKASLRPLVEIPVYTNKTSIGLRVALEVEPGILQDYLEANLTLDGKPVNTSIHGGVLEANLSLTQGAHRLVLEAKYYNLTVGRAEWRIVVDTTPPEITVEKTQDGRIEVLVRDNTTGILSVKATSNGKTLYRRTLGGMKEYRFTLSPQAGLVTITAVDMAGNRAEKNITLTPTQAQETTTATTTTKTTSPGGGTTTTTLQPAPTGTPGATPTTQTTQTATVTVTKTATVTRTLCPETSLWATSLSVTAITVSLLAITLLLRTRKEGEEPGKQKY